jgi:hypothetical protein
MIFALVIVIVVVLFVYFINNLEFLVSTNNKTTTGAFDKITDDLKVVRGTNSSVFLSCYREDDGNWYMMSKGYQIRHGFVPMSETIDSGILGLFGVNKDYISFYPPDKIKDSATYANRVKKYDPLENLDRYMLWACDETYAAFKGTNYEANNACNAVLLIYLILRLKQYYGSHAAALNPLDQLKRKYRELKCSEVWEERKNGFKRRIGKITSLANYDYSKYRQQYLEGSNEIKLEIDNKIRSEIDKELLGEAYEGYMRINCAFDPYEPIRDDMPNMGPGISCIIRNIMQNDSYKKELLDRANNDLEWIETVQTQLNNAIRNEPKFKLTDEDKKILENPIPLLFASTTEGTVISEKTHEYGIKDKIKIGSGGMDVVYVKAKDRDALMKILSDRDINDLQVRVNDTIFGE